MLFCFAAPTAPRNFISTEITTRSISVSWDTPDPPNGVIINYIVSDFFLLINSFYSSYFQVSIALTAEMTNRNMTNISATDDTTFTFTDLMLFSGYQLNIMAFTRVGQGSVASLTVMTLPDGEPHNIYHEFNVLNSL